MDKDGNSIMKPAIVVIAYNRPRSLNRILNSLADAEYTDVDIPLLISIDKSDNVEVAKIAEAFCWKFGKKEVRYFDENQGLKKHVLSCGDLTEKYGSLIMLEDDLFVSSQFYQFAKASLDFTDLKDEIGGVSLYNHLFNVHKREPFEAVNDGYDNWYFQFASSWGQAFTKNQWKGFRSWLKENDNKDLSDITVPCNVSQWSDKSWLKYYIKYLIEENKYFLYPRISYTTNFFDVGTHSEKAQTDFQVPLCFGMQRAFVFSNICESQSVYDSFFENRNLAPYLPVEGKVEIDLYGLKRYNTKYCLTSKRIPFHVIKSFGMKLRPLDANIIKQIPGNEIFLYDLEKKEQKPQGKDSGRILYHFRGFKISYILKIIEIRWKERKL